MKSKIISGHRGDFARFSECSRCRAATNRIIPASGGYGYALRTGILRVTPVVVGDYDEHRSWHDRDWWGGEHRDWVNDHHEGSRGGHNESNEHEAHADRGNDHNHDRD